LAASLKLAWLKLAWLKLASLKLAWLKLALGRPADCGQRLHVS